MQNNIENINNKIIGKHKILLDMILSLKYTNELYKKTIEHVIGYSMSSKQIKNKQRESFCNGLASDIEHIEMDNGLLINYYEDIAGPHLMDFYKLKISDSVQIKKISDNLIIDLQSRGILDKMNQIYNAILMASGRMYNYTGFKNWVSKYTNILEILSANANHHVVEDQFLADLLENAENVGVIETIPDNVLNKLGYAGTMERLSAAYIAIKLQFNIEKIDTNLCICGEKLSNPDDNVEIVCLKCGAVKILVGTAHDSDKSDKYMIVNVKNKRYEPKRHCDKRLMQIQAKEDKKIPQEVIDELIKIARMEYRYGNGTRSMQNMPCTQIRRWLKQKSFTKYNHHAPLIRKLVTAEFGEAISPPQLTPEEEQQILLDFNIAIKCYEDTTQSKAYKEKFENIRNRTRQRNKPNKFYYWFVLFQIISTVLPDSDKRKNRLLECIHMQSDETIDKDDAIWKLMCESGGMPKGYVFKKTDKNITAKIF